MSSAQQQKWPSDRINIYTLGTLENNWNEERYDLKYLKEHHALPSPVGSFINMIDCYL
jgi:hypothetical protein